MFDLTPEKRKVLAQALMKGAGQFGGSSSAMSQALGSLGQVAGQYVTKKANEEISAAEKKKKDEELAALIKQLKAGNGA